MSDTLINSFRLERVINEGLCFAYIDPRAKSLNILGVCEVNDQRLPAVLLMERAFFTPLFVDSLKRGPQEVFSKLETIGQNDVYTWVLGWQQDRAESGAHSKITLICPAGDEVIAKYSSQARRMITETPELYQDVTRQWIDSIPKSKTNWVRNILEGISEAESVLYRDDDPKTGFVIVPDLKWDRRTLGSLYLVAIVKDPNLSNLRDLTREHIPLLKKIREAGAKVATEKYGLPPPSESGEESSLRCFLHYMPTFLYVTHSCSHLHVHMLSVNFISHPGAIIGQAQLLEDVVGLLELGVDFKKRVLGYQLTEGHALLGALRAHRK